jgi:hypothetical protein
MHIAVVSRVKIQRKEESIFNEASSFERLLSSTNGILQKQRSLFLKGRQEKY